MIDHFAYPLPFNRELFEMGKIPYRTNKTLKDKIHYLYSHPKFEHRKLYLNIYKRTDGQLLEEMSGLGVAQMQYFLDNPQQFAHKADNIHLQLLVSMWKHLFFFTQVKKIKLEKYHAMKMKMLSVDNGLIEELIRTCEEKDYLFNDDMVKTLEERGIDHKQKVMYDKDWKKCKRNIRAKKSLGTQDESSANFRYIIELAENEQGSLL